MNLFSTNINKKKKKENQSAMIWNWKFHKIFTKFMCKFDFDQIFVWIIVLWEYSFVVCYMDRHLLRLNVNLWWTFSLKNIYPTQYLMYMFKDS